MTSQIAVFQRKNKVLARVGVAALNRFFKTTVLLRKNIGFQQRLTLSLTLSGLRKPISASKVPVCLLGFKIYIEKRGQLRLLAIC